MPVMSARLIYTLTIARAGSAPLGIHPRLRGFAPKFHRSIDPAESPHLAGAASLSTRAPLCATSRLSRSISAESELYSAIFRRRKRIVTFTFSSRPFGLRTYTYDIFL